MSGWPAQLSVSTDPAVPSPGSAVVAARRSSRVSDDQRGHDHFPYSCGCSVAQLCPTLCDPAARQASLSCTILSELAQTHVHGVDDAIRPSHFLYFSLLPLPSILYSSVFLCAFWCPFTDFGGFFRGELCVSFLLVWSKSLHILSTSLFSPVYYANIFSYWVGLALSL